MTKIKEIPLEMRKKVREAMISIFQAGIDFMKSEFHDGELNEKQKASLARMVELGPHRAPVSVIEVISTRAAENAIREMLKSGELSISDVQIVQVELGREDFGSEEFDA